jgi:hypothetical protein
MLGKLSDRFCFNSIFLFVAVLILGGLQLSSFFNASEGGNMTGPNPVLPITVGFWTRPDSPKVVTDKNIFDYMDGAGELYLGYRFDHLDVYEYKAQSQKEILVELYFMKSSDDAFGLLSLDWGGDYMNLTSDTQNEVMTDFVWPRALYGEGLLRLWTENIYARVMATHETSESKEAVLSIGRAIVKDRKNPPSPDIARRLTDSLSLDWALRPDRFSFFRTHLVLNSLYYLSHENILDLDLACEAVAAQYEKKALPGGRTRIQFLLVHYPDSNRAKQALSHFHSAYLNEHPFSATADPSEKISDIFSVEDGWMAYSFRERSIAFVFECPDEETARAILNQMQ